MEDYKKSRELRLRQIKDKLNSKVPAIKVSKPSDEKVIRITNDFVNSRLSYSKTTLNVFLFLLTKIDENTETLDFFYSEIMEGIGYKTTHGNSTEIHNSLEDLWNTSFYFKSDDGDTKSKRRLITTITKSKEKSVMLRLNTDVMDILMEVKNNYTLVSMNTLIKKLPTTYSKRLYMWLMSFKDTSYFTIPVDELRDRLMLKPTMTYGHIKSNILLPSLDYINTHTDCKVVSFEEKKFGRGQKVMRIEIHFKYKKPSQLNLELDTSTDNKRRIVERLKELKLSLIQIKIIMNTLTPKEVNKTLYEINLRQSDRNIMSIQHYAQSCFEREYDLTLDVKEIKSKKYTIDEIKEKVDKRNKHYKNLGKKIGNKK